MCLTSSVIYRATVDKGSEKEGIYVGLTEGDFKQRYTKHKASFSNEEKCNETKLSNFVWEKKNVGKDPKISWEILTCAPSYHPACKNCLLCSKEKLTILECDYLINSKTEIVNTCRHRRKWLLSQVK